MQKGKDWTVWLIGCTRNRKVRLVTFHADGYPRGCREMAKDFINMQEDGNCMVALVRGQRPKRNSDNYDR